MSDIKELETARQIIKEQGDDAAYDVATWILYCLENKNYCIWQTYTQDDIKINMGRKPTNDEMEEMQERLANTFEYIRPEEV